MFRYLILPIGDGLLAAAALHLGSVVGLGFSGAEEQGRVLQFVLLPLVAVALAYLVELYDLNRRASAKELFSRILLAAFGALSAFVAIHYVFHVQLFDRGVLALTLALLVASQFCWHMGYRAILRSEHLTKKVLVLGTGPLAKKIGDLMQTRNHQHVLTGYLSLNGEPVSVAPQSILGTEATEQLAETVKKKGADKVVVSLSERRGAFPLQDVLTCKFRGIEVLDAPTFYEHLTGKLLIENITPSWFIFSRGFRINAATRICKRTADIIGSLVGLVALALLLPVLAALIKLDSRGPLFFGQVRVGQHDKNFMLYKFRTMCENAEEGTGAVWASENDTRVTRIGRLLRKSRIDELPQLYNVLKGDMSFIGPRPERPEFAEKLKKIVPYYSQRHCIKPGITGWAQIRYPYGASAKDALEKLRYDLFYIKNMSFFLETAIAFETIKVVLFGRGAR